MTGSTGEQLFYVLMAHASLSLTYWALGIKHWRAITAGGLTVLAVGCVAMMVLSGCIQVGCS